jgi:hypothetical protein
METSILKKLNAKPTEKYTCEQFSHGLLNYEMVNDTEIKIYFSEVCFTSGSDLRPKNIVSFRYDWNDLHGIFPVSKELLLEYDDIFNYIMHHLKVRLLNQ